MGSRTHFPFRNGQSFEGSLYTWGFDRGPAQGLYTRDGPEHLLILCGVLGGKVFGVKFSRRLAKFWDKVFKGLDCQHGPERAHLLDNDHLYYQFMEGKFPSLTFPFQKHSGPKTKPHHFTCDKVGPQIFFKLGQN